MEVGDRVYKVRWIGNQPFICPGVVVDASKKRKTRKVKWKGVDKLGDLKEGFRTMEEAIEANLIHHARKFVPDGIFQTRKAEPWRMAEGVAKLLRLHSKLRRHHLV